MEVKKIAGVSVRVDLKHSLDYETVVKMALNSPSNYLKKDARVDIEREFQTNGIFPGGVEIHGDPVETPLGVSISAETIQQNEVLGDNTGKVKKPKRGRRGRQSDTTE